MISKHIYKKQGIELNYYEITNSLQPLVLIHAQGVDATSFKMFGDVYLKSIMFIQ